jgi:hypothetical protein
MKIDIRTIQVFLVSPGEGRYRGRTLTVFQRLLDAGFQRITFVRSIPDTAGMNSLTRTNLLVMRESLKTTEPFIILEDDCEIWNLPKESIEIPDDADAVYLGVSQWIYPHAYERLGQNFTPILPNGPPFIESVSDICTRIKGMTSTHAILYLGRAYIKKCIDAIEPRLVFMTPHDLVLATQHASHNVYALKEPIFYQDSILQGQEAVTKLRFDGTRYS